MGSNNGCRLFNTNVDWLSTGLLRTNFSEIFINSSPPGATYICQWIGSALVQHVQIMASCLFGTKPLSKPVLGYCQLDFQWNFNQNMKFFLFTKMHLKIPSVKSWQPFYPGWEELNTCRTGTWSIKRVYCFMLVISSYVTHRYMI